MKRTLFSLLVVITAIGIKAHQVAVTNDANKYYQFILQEQINRMRQFNKCHE